MKVMGLWATIDPDVCQVPKGHESLMTNLLSGRYLTQTYSLDMFHKSQDLLSGRSSLEWKIYHFQAICLSSQVIHSLPIQAVRVSTELDGAHPIDTAQTSVLTLPLRVPQMKRNDFMMVAMGNNGWERL